MPGKISDSKLTQNQQWLCKRYGWSLRLSPEKFKEKVIKKFESEEEKDSRVSAMLLTEALKSPSSPVQ